MIRPEEEKPTMNNKLQSFFPKTDKIFQEMPAEIESKNKTPISNCKPLLQSWKSQVSTSLMVVKMPNFEKKLEMFRLGEKMKKLIDLLEWEDFHELLRRNKTSTYIDTGNIFLIISAAGFKVRKGKSESIFSFIAAWQDYDKKFVQIEFSYSDDYNIFVSKILMRIKGAEHYKCDILHNKNSKFLF